MFHDPSIRKILLIEDNPGDIGLIQGVVSELSFAVHLQVISDGLQAMEYLEKEDNLLPDIILLDLSIPKIDGRELLKEIKRNSSLKHIPIIVVTISQSEEDILLCYKYYANCYIIKTFDVDSFIEHIKVMLTFWLTVATLPKKKEANCA